MKTIAFLYNVRHFYLDVNDYQKQLEADFDDPETTKWQIKHLRNLGFKVIPIEANEKAYLSLYKNKKNIDLVFNVAEGIYGEDRELQVPAMLEMLQIPYTGSKPLTHGFSLNKEKAKQVFLATGIATAPFQTVSRPDFDLDEKLKFPLIVKPIAQGSSMGITNKSVVYDISSLRKQVKKVINAFKQPAIIEPFLNGREFSIAMLGNPGKLLPIIEPNHDLLPKKYLPFDSYEVKWYFEEQSDLEYLVCPAKLSGKLEKCVHKICHKVWSALNILDWCRVDIKCDLLGNPFVLEINSPAGLIPPEVSKTSYFPLAARAAGMDYEEMLLEIIKSAAKRYGISLKP